jgi:hypothetical protein
MNHKNDTFDYSAAAADGAAVFRYKNTFNATFTVLKMSSVFS